MQTEEPYWLPEAYASAINETDIGTVYRAITYSNLVEGIILTCFDKHAKFIDYGAGYGVLVRLMRDRGFDFYWEDRFCENIFAKQFVVRPGMEFELLAAIEVFEHLQDPLAGIARMLEYSNNVVFSTLIIPDNLSSDWWYLGCEHGQHISFYTVAALELIAKRFNLYLSTDGSEVHLISHKRVPARLLRFFAHDTLKSRLARRLLRRHMRRQSLLVDDYEVIAGQLKAETGKKQDEHRLPEVARSN